MKLKTIQMLSIAALIGSAANVALAADKDGPWSLSLIGGDSVGTSGTLTSPRSATVDLGRLDPTLTGSGTLSVDKLKYDDIFDRDFDVGAELGYALSDHLQAFGRFDYESLSGRKAQLGKISSAALPSGGGLSARFADADNYSFDLGARYFWRTGSAWRPFAAAAIGATHLDGISAAVKSDGGALDLGNVRFTRSGTVFNQMVEAGIEYRQSDAFGVSLSVDATHAGAPPSADDARFSAAGVNLGRNAEESWSFPVTVMASYHF